MKRRQPKVPTKAAVKAAWAIIEAERAVKREADHATKRAFIGRYFKYRNTYGGADAAWWLYASPTMLDDGGTLQGLVFQTTCHGEIEINPNRGSLITLPSSWQEIKAEEFWTAATELQCKVLNLLRGDAPES